MPFISMALGLKALIALLSQLIKVKTIASLFTRALYVYIELYSTWLYETISILLKLLPLNLTMSITLYEYRENV